LNFNISIIRLSVPAKTRTKLTFEQTANGTASANTNLFYAQLKKLGAELLNSALAANCVVRLLNLRETLMCKQHSLFRQTATEQTVRVMFQNLLAIGFF
jgi:hypothetical protein